jgi:hypothetical protein
MTTAQISPKAQVRASIKCPKCKQDITRINKTLFDKIINYFYPIRRYKCYGCLWEGLKSYQRGSRRSQAADTRVADEDSDMGG